MIASWHENFCPGLSASASSTRPTTSIALAPIAIHPARWPVTARATTIEAIIETPPVAGTRASLSGDAAFAVMPIHRPKRVATGIVIIAAKNVIAAVAH